MKNLLCVVVIVLCLSMASCSTISESINAPAIATITENRFDCEGEKCISIPVKSFVVTTSKQDAVVSYKEGDVAISVDNKGSKSFARAVAEKLVENSAVVLSTADNVEK